MHKAQSSLKYHLQYKAWIHNKNRNTKAKELEIQSYVVVTFFIFGTDRDSPPTITSW